MGLTLKPCLYISGTLLSHLINIKLFQYFSWLPGRHYLTLKLSNSRPMLRRNFLTFPLIKLSLSKHAYSWVL
jgi:hypothetical protein